MTGAWEQEIERLRRGRPNIFSQLDSWMEDSAFGGKKRSKIANYKLELFCGGVEQVTALRVMFSRYDPTLHVRL